MAKANPGKVSKPSGAARRGGEDAAAPRAPVTRGLSTRRTGIVEGYRSGVGLARKELDGPMRSSLILPLSFQG